MFASSSTTAIDAIPLIVVERRATSRGVGGRVGRRSTQPLPETAAVDRLRMKIGERVIEGS